MSLLKKPTNRQIRKARFEALEDRNLMAVGITASLNSSGVLTIQGTSAADTISLHDQSNKITIDGVTGSFAATSVKQIQINLGSGNETVHLDTLAVSGKVTLNVPIAVASGAGCDTLIDLTGHTYYFSGVGHTFAINAKGADLLDNQAPSWMDSNLKTAAIRTLAKQDFARDGDLNRNDMIALLRQVEQAGAMTSTELSDLQTIVNDAALFTSVAYVDELASNIVLGDAANAHYQGTVLGNLAVGSSAANLEKLVDKWFLGADHPLGTSAWGPTYSYTTASGSLFAHAPAYTDIVQGGIGDCYLLSSLAETALRDPSYIQSMFIVNGDGTFTVRFMNSGKTRYVTVDMQLPVDAYGQFVFADMGQSAANKGNTLWVALAEKAFVQMNEEGWARNGLGGNLFNAYNSISGGYIGNALSDITGHAPTSAYTTSTQSFAAFVAAYNSGALIGFGSVSNPSSSLVVGGHAYAVVGYSASTQKVTLYNPWGNNNGSQYPGVITLSWPQIQSNFSEFDRVSA